MNTQKSVYNRLFSKEEKTELESHKVELSLLGDLKKLEEEYFKTYDNTREVRKLGVALKKKAKSSFQDLSKTEKKIKKALDEFEKAAKDLGLKADKVEEYKSLKRILTSDIPDYLKIFEQAQDFSTL